MKYFSTVIALQAGAWPQVDSYDSPIGNTNDTDASFVLGASLLLVIGIYWLYRNIDKK